MSKLATSTSCQCSILSLNQKKSKNQVHPPITQKNIKWSAKAQLTGCDLYTHVLFRIQDEPSRDAPIDAAKKRMTITAVTATTTTCLRQMLHAIVVCVSTACIPVLLHLHSRPRDAFLSKFARVCDCLADFLLIFLAPEVVNFFRDDFLTANAPVMRRTETGRMSENFMSCKIRRECLIWKSRLIFSSFSYKEGNDLSLRHFKTC